MSTITSTNVEPRGILPRALPMNAAAVAVAQEPTLRRRTVCRELGLFTRQLIEAGKVLRVEIAGSIVGGGRSGVGACRLNNY